MNESASPDLKPFLLLTTLPMPAPDDVFRFEAVLDCFNMGGLGKVYFLDFPYPVEEIFGRRSSVRMAGTINHLAVDRALLPRKDGPHFLLLNKDMCKKAGAKLGEKVRVVLQRVANPEEVPLPEELEEALDLEPGARQQFDALSPGRKRNITIYINQAKRPETRAQRAVFMLNKLLAGDFKPAKRKPAQFEPDAEDLK